MQTRQPGQERGRFKSVHGCECSLPQWLTAVAFDPELYAMQFRRPFSEIQRDDTRIGEGGSGTTYTARVHGSLAAVKILKPGITKQQVYTEVGLLGYVVDRFLGCLAL